MSTVKSLGLDSGNLENVKPAVKLEVPVDNLRAQSYAFYISTNQERIIHNQDLKISERLR